MDAVLIANEIVDERRRLGEEGVVFKIDFEKAYDHVRWDFLDQVLEKKGAKGWVKASRGLRQGDPLSPFLFTLVADVLSRMLLRAEERNMLEGFRVVEIELGSILTRVIFLVINLDQAHISRLAETLECKASGWPILYLGLPLGGNPRQLPALVAAKIERLQRDFLWSGIGEGKRDHLVREMAVEVFPSKFVGILSSFQSEVLRLHGESADHIFLHCSLTIGLWHRGIALWQVASIALIRIVWWERNARIFEDKARNSEYLWDSIVFLASLWTYCSKEKGNYGFLMLQETKRKLCDKRFVGCVWKVRNKEWVVLPVCGASRRVRIIWDSNKFSYLEVVLNLFSNNEAMFR
ncbi:hypothetical protein CK203_026101 [Vitis vinifera]|uniref:Reverse transcriptase domain-containing protein n=1 Tax=Vitis vinifera TaxID=29760 RepID=A0A438IJ83_VITVI|nr:hypothetical protein CK203_026101 [Vitis vinifera]